MKKIFGSLAVLAILFTAVACNGNTTDIGAVGTISGGDVAYDAATGTVNKELTINLTDVTLKSALTKDQEISEGDLGIGLCDIKGLSITAAADAAAGDSSFKILISGTPTEITDASLTEQGKTEGYDTYFLLIPGDSFLQAKSDAKVGRIEYITGGKFTGLRKTASAEASATSGQTSISITLTGATYTTALSASDITITGVTSTGASIDLGTLTPGAVAGTPDGNVTITTTNRVSAGTYTVTITKPSCFTKVTDYVVPTSKMTFTFTVS